MIQISLPLSVNSLKLKRKATAPVRKSVARNEWSNDHFFLPGKLKAGLVPRHGHPIGSGQLFMKWRRNSSPVTGPSTPAILNRAFAPAGQSHGRSLFPVSITPVSLHFLQVDIFVPSFQGSNNHESLVVGLSEYYDSDTICYYRINRFGSQEAVVPLAGLEPTIFSLSRLWRE